MNTNELFIDESKLPKTLPKAEVYELIDRINRGDELALKKLIEHNIRLILYEVNIGRFSNVEYDKKDLVSVGNIGLIKAIRSFDTSKNVEFATYARKCIDNEILLFLRSIKKDKNVDSLDRIISEKNDNILTVGDMISDKTDVAEECIYKERNELIRQVVMDLPDRDRKIIMLHFGFYDDRIYTQREIAEIISVSQSYVSRLIIKNLKKLGSQLKEKGIVELEQSQKEKMGSNKKNDIKKIKLDLKNKG